MLILPIRHQHVDLKCKLPAEDPTRIKKLKYPMNQHLGTGKFGYMDSTNICPGLNLQAHQRFYVAALWPHFLLATSARTDMYSSWQPV